jgi:hypothetical protein
LAGLSATGAKRWTRQITHGTTTITVTRAAKVSMGSALDVMVNQPTVFFKCHYAVKAATDTLGVDMLKYSMPQTQEELDDFD